MTVSPNTQAILLLTAHFSKSRNDDAKPLTPKEWGRFAAWLKDHASSPEQLMAGNPAEALRDWSDKHITLGRIEALMGRGSALAIAMEKWLRAGLWVMTRSDSDYPLRLKRRLGTDSPAVLFGCGPRSLLNSGGLAVIGSRDAGDDDLEYARVAASIPAQQGRTVVSGGARGVDEAAMLGALDAGGTVVGVLADSLMQACSSSKYRRHLLANSLALVSPFHPEAGFNAGNAMQRNRYIYCLADAALVVHSGTKGGTWNGAIEDLRSGWVPLWIKPTEDESAGNAQLVEQGAHWTTECAEKLDVGCLIASSDQASSSDQRKSLGAESVNESGTAFTTTRHESNVPSVATAPEVAGTEPHVSTNQQLEESRSPPLEIDFYDLFLRRVHRLCFETPRTADELVEALGLNKTQINTAEACRGGEARKANA